MNYTRSTRHFKVDPRGQIRSQRVEEARAQSRKKIRDISEIYCNANLKYVFGIAIIDASAVG